MSTLSTIIGKQGSRIQEIQRTTGARINVDKNSQRGGGLDDDDMVDIEVQGNSVTIALAERQLQSIVKEKTSTVNLRMRDIPPELFPFIAGPHNAHISNYEDGRDVRVKVPHYHTWGAQPPPQSLGANQPAAFQPQEGYYITVSGDREHALEVQQEIQQRAAQLQRQLITSQFEIEREKHRFILGENAAAPHDFLQETRCSIIMPPSTDDTETITVVGPPEDVKLAIDKAMDFALSMAMTSIDISRQHPNTSRSVQAHAQDVARYLQQRQALEELERTHESSIVIPDSAGPWQIYSRDGKNGIRARKDITDLISAQVPSRYRPIDRVHPYFQQHLQQHHAQSIRDQYGVHLVIAEPDAEDSSLLLVYEGDGPANNEQLPRAKPAANEIAQFEQSLGEAEQYLMNLLQGQGEVVRHTIDTPSKYQDKLHRHATRQAEQPSNGGFPIQVLGFDSANTGASPNTVPFAFRGPSSEVDKYRQSLLNFIEEQVRDEAERGYTTSCEFPQKFMNQLIGRRGETINKLREEFDVEIRAQDGTVEIQGPKTKADAARSHILTLARKAEDETTHTVKIKPQFHGELIGPKGMQIRRLQDRYNVRIDFPRGATSSPDSQSMVDGEVAGAAKGRRSQEPDVVVIKGTKRGADEARSEILDLYQYMQDHAHSSVVSVAQSLLPSLIGQGGRELDKLRLETGASIDVPGPRDARDPSGRVEVKLRGTKDQVQKATQEISKRAKTFDESTTRTLDISKKHHGALIGRNGENIRSMVLQAGGREDERSRLIRFPPANSQENEIKLEGHQDIVEKLAAAIQAYVDEQEQQVTETINVPQERHGGLIGAGGETRRRLESEYMIILSIPDRTTQGPAREAVKISGLPANVEKAKDALLEMTKSSSTAAESETIQMPRHLHHHVYSQHGSRLRDMRVRLDHAGQQRPAKPAPSAGRTTAPSSLPLITDVVSDPPAIDIRQHHGWNTLDAEAFDEDTSTTIPWVLRAQEAAEIEKAKEMIMAAIAAEQESVTGYLMLPDPSLNTYVIGPHGSTINTIRRETGCRIDVPKKDGAGAEPIEIRGDAKAVEQAKEMILDAVTNGRQHQ